MLSPIFCLSEHPLREHEDLPMGIAQTKREAVQVSELRRLPERLSDTSWDAKGTISIGDGLSNAFEGSMALADCNLKFSDACRMDLRLCQVTCPKIVLTGATSIFSFIK